MDIMTHTYLVKEKPPSFSSKFSMTCTASIKPSVPKLNIIETDLKVQVVFAVSIVCSKPQNVMIVAS